MQGPGINTQTQKDKVNAFMKELKEMRKRNKEPNILEKFPTFERCRHSNESET